MEKGSSVFFGENKSYTASHSQLSKGCLLQTVLKFLLLLQSFASFSGPRYTVVVFHVISILWLRVSQNAVSELRPLFSSGWSIDQLTRLYTFHFFRGQTSVDAVGIPHKTPRLQSLHTLFRTWTGMPLSQKLFAISCTSCKLIFTFSHSFACSSGPNEIAGLVLRCKETPESKAKRKVRKR